MKHYIIVYSLKSGVDRFAWHSFLSEKDNVLRMQDELSAMEEKYGILDLAYHMIETEGEDFSTVRLESTFFRDVILVSEEKLKEIIINDNIKVKLQTNKLVINNNKHDSFNTKNHLHEDNNAIRSNMIYENTNKSDNLLYQIQEGLKKDDEY